MILLWNLIFFESYPLKKRKMRKFIILAFLCTLQIAYAQNGKIYVKNTGNNSVEKKLFVYEPPKSLSIPEPLFVTLLYGELPIKFISLPLQKTGLQYEFRLKLPDSIHVLYAEIQDKKNKVIDNNAEKGYVVLVNQNKNLTTEKKSLEALKLKCIALYAFPLKIKNEELVQSFEDLYKAYPSLKDDKSYVIYLNIKSRVDPDKTKPELLAYAQQLEKKGSENNLADASNIYRNLKMTEQYEQIEKTSLAKFPAGGIAKRMFWKSIYALPVITENALLDSMHQFIKIFGDTTAETKNQFYYFLIRKYIKDKDTTNLNKYASLFKNKDGIASLSNNYAWELVDGSLESPGKDLDYAAYLSHKAVTISKDHLMHPSEDDDIRRLQGEYNNNSDTYALVLYKQKIYNQAFEYEDAIQKQDELDNGGKERYAAIAEKAKGLEFTRKYIEIQLLAGADSKTLLIQLQRIYQQLHVPENTFEKLKEESARLVEQKNNEKISKIYGSTNEIDFTLNTLDSAKVTLSDYKGQVVVLDFWATWCGPCKASFPGMQQLVNKYKEKNVKFLFVDAFENDKENVLRGNIRQFLNDNKYSFNVLLDLTNNTSQNYKINSIPSKIIIDKNGKIVHLVVGSGAEEQLSYIIDGLL